MDAGTLLAGCGLSAVLGAFGQGMRAVGGLKKQFDEAHEKGKKLADVFEGVVFAFSLFVGVVAGVAAYLGMIYGSKDGVDWDKGTSVLGIIAAGYAGADFIESFAKKYLPK
ncbi:hypothetical protein [Roseateles sp. P5_E11]